MNSVTKGIPDTEFKIAGEIWKCINPYPASV